MSASRNILIIGGGPAGTFAAIGARQQDPAAHVRLLTDEPCEPYEKPPLSKTVLLGTANAADAPIAGPAGLAAHGVAVDHNARCVGIDRPSKEVVLRDGRRLPYDALVLATGAEVRQVPEFPEGTPGVHYLRNVADAETLKAALAASRHLLVVGGGLIGLEVAAAAAELGVGVTVVEVAPRILARVCYADIGSLVQSAHERRGVVIRVGCAIRSVERAPDGRMAVTVDPGGTIVADTLVVGIGAQPDVALAREAGLAIDDGLLVDGTCRTSDPSIFAAGDVTRFPGPDGPIRLENWRHALDQGAIAGRNAAGGHEIYATLPSFWSEQYDLYIQGVGWPAAGASTVSRPMTGGSALQFEVRDGRLAYALGVNAQRDLSIARRLIERKVPVEASALADPSHQLTALLKRG